MALHEALNDIENFYCTGLSEQWVKEYSSDGQVLMGMIMTYCLYVNYTSTHVVCVGPPREEKWAAEYISEVDDRAKQW